VEFLYLDCKNKLIRQTINLYEPDYKMKMRENGSKKKMGHQQKKRRKTTTLEKICDVSAVAVR
jgi:hypothetical protein